MSVEQVSPRVHRVRHLIVNCYLVSDPGELTLIDAGFPSSARRILEAIESIGRRPAELRRVLLTHAHFDHCGALAEIGEHTGAEVWAHPLEAAEVRAGSTGPGFASAPFAPPLSPLVRRITARPPRIRPVEVVRELAGGERLDVGGGLEVLHTPGHAPGHLSFLLPGEDLLVAGDACGTLFGLGPPLGWVDEAAGVASLHRLGAMAYRRAVFGHGAPIREDAARRIRDRFAGPPARGAAA